MEAILSIVCALAGLAALRWFLVDWGRNFAGGAESGGKLRLFLKLALALLLLHFHFELDILD